MQVTIDYKPGLGDELDTRNIKYYSNSLTYKVTFECRDIQELCDIMYNAGQDY